jgi:putative oxidoreductase
MAIPAFLAYLAVFSQFLGGLALIFGFATRIAALGIAVDMVVAIFLVHLPNGLFMNWYGNQKAEGFEYHLLATAIALTLVIAGGGILSIDRSIAAPREAYR